MTGEERCSIICNLFRYGALAGNILYIFWIVYNGMDEGLRDATPVHVIAYVGILCLLGVNAVLLYRCGKEYESHRS